MKVLKSTLALLILFSSFAKAQWIQQSSGISQNLYSVFFVDENTGWTCGTGGVILKTTNGGLEWFQQISNTINGLDNIHFVDQDNGWASSENQILHTTDRGQNWNVQNFNAGSIRSLQFVSLNVGWIIASIVGDTAAVYNTNNGGVTWTVEYQSENEQFLSMYFLDENTGWITSPFTFSVLKTTDGGNSWAQHSANLSGAPEDIVFVDELTGWISHNTLGSYSIIKSTDGGVNWFEQIGESSKFINSISFANTDVGYAAGWQMYIPPNPDQEFILKTTDGGTSWVEQYRDEGVLNSIYFVNEMFGCAVGNGGKILTTDNGGVTSIEDEITSFTPDEFRLSQNYPNPFNPSTMIRYEIPGQARNDNMLVVLKVYDVLGNEIATLVDEEKPEGNYEIEFDASQISSGIYYYQLKAGSFVETKKMILLR